MNAIAAERIDAGHGPEAGIAGAEWKPIGRIGALFPDPLDDDADDDEVVVTTRRAIGRVALVATETAERAITGRAVSDITAAEFGRLALSELQDIPADLQGSASYRARVGAAMVARAWTDATTEALDA